MIIRKEAKPEFLINKISLVEYARVKGKLIGGRIECAIPGDHRVPTEQRLSWAFDELDTAIRFGANGLTFPNSSEVVREWGIKATIKNSKILEWATDPGNDALKGSLQGKALSVLDALVTFGGDQGGQTGERILEGSFCEIEGSERKILQRVGSEEGLLKPIKVWTTL